MLTKLQNWADQVLGIPAMQELYEAASPEQRSEFHRRLRKLQIVKVFVLAIILVGALAMSWNVAMWFDFETYIALALVGLFVALRVKATR